MFNLIIFIYVNVDKERETIGEREYLLPASLFLQVLEEPNYVTVQPGAPNSV